MNVQPRDPAPRPAAQDPGAQNPAAHNPAAQAPRPQDEPPVRLAPTPREPRRSGGAGGSGGSRGTVHGRRRFRPRYLLIPLVLWLAFLVGTPIYAWTKADEVAFSPTASKLDDQPGTTYLLVGSDSRAGLTAEQRKEYGTGNASGQRTDTIMLLHTGSGPNLLMSIPRDSLVDVPGYGTTKINAAYAYGGAKLLVKTIQQNTGIKIDQYVEIGLGGLVNVVDAVGGIEICPEQNMVDKLANLDIKKGCQEVDGTTALAYARSRHVSGLGDIDRAKHQREVVSAVGAKVLSPWTFINPVRYWKLNMAVTQTFTFGDGMHWWNAGLWAMAMTSVNGDDGLTCGVPISDLAVHWDPERSTEMFQAIIDDDTESIGDDLCTASGLEGNDGN
ncbi:LytR family transcriptional regulator [Nocardioides sp. GY 10127]|nr:LytR family transcriptional regulator [Nocardioides sp. GY 10127]